MEGSRTYSGENWMRIFIFKNPYYTHTETWSCTREEAEKELKNDVYMSGSKYHKIMGGGWAHYPFRDVESSCEQLILAGEQIIKDNKESLMRLTVDDINSMYRYRTHEKLGE